MKIEGNEIVLENEGEGLILVVGTLLFIVTVFLFCLLTIPLIPATLSGECNSIEFPNEDNVSIEFVLNNSNMEGFNWSKNGTNITYCIDRYYVPDNVTIKWYNYQNVYIDEPQQGGSGGSYTKKKVIVVNETNKTEEVIDTIEELSPIDDEGVIVIESDIPEEKNTWKIVFWIVMGLLIIVFIWWVLFT